MAGAVHRMEPFFQLGVDNLRVSMELHALNRQRLIKALRTIDNNTTSRFVILQGGVTNFQDSTDRELIFRQESYFHWLFGVLEPDCYGVLDVDTGKVLKGVHVSSTIITIMMCKQYCGQIDQLHFSPW